MIFVAGEAGVGQTRLVRAAGVAATEHGYRWLAATGSEHESGRSYGVSPILAGAIQDLLTSPPPDAVALANALAVLATPVPLQVAARVASLTGPGHTELALEHLLAAGLAVWWPRHPTTTVGVRHPLQREAIYHMLSPTQRRELHAAAATTTTGSARWAHRVAAAAGPPRPDRQR